MKLAYEILLNLMGLTLVSALTLATLLGLNALLHYWGAMAPMI
jgi:hypothetical protein